MQNDALCRGSRKKMYLLVDSPLKGEGGLMGYPLRKTAIFLNIFFQFVALEKLNIFCLSEISKY